MLLEVVTPEILHNCTYVIQSNLIAGLYLFVVEARIIIRLKEYFDVCDAYTFICSQADIRMLPIPTLFHGCLEYSIEFWMHLRFFFFYK